MALHGEYDPDNIFAKMVRGEIPAVKVYEDDVVMAFMDIFPQSEGHTLVIPKRDEARNFLEMPPEKLGPYMERVQKVARAVEAALKPDGVTVMQFNGGPAGQTVFHLHFHIVPRWSDRPMSGHGSSGQADPAELEATAYRIRNAF